MVAKYVPRRRAISVVVLSFWSIVAGLGLGRCEGRNLSVGRKVFISISQTTRLIPYPGSVAIIY